MSSEHAHCRVEEVFEADPCAPGTCAFVDRCAFEHVDAADEDEVFDAVVEMRRTVEALRG